MKSILQGIGATQNLYLIDCQHGNHLFGPNSPDPLPIVKEYDYLSIPSRYGICSGVDSWPGHDESDIGKFAYGIVKAIRHEDGDYNGDGYITGTELFKYLCEYNVDAEAGMNLTDVHCTSDGRETGEFILYDPVDVAPG